MRKLLILPFALIYFSSFSQALSDSLEKYSYLVLHIIEGNQIAAGNSTGFFIRDNGKLYFLTTYHTCSCIDGFKKKPFNPEWDFLYIRTFSRSGTIIYYPINLTTLKSHRKIEYFTNNPDICVYTLNEPEDSVKINSLEQIVNLKDTVREGPMNTVFYGFPRESTDTADASSIVATKNKGNLRFALKQPIEIAELNKIDSNILIVEPKTMHGASGSPLFFQYFTKKGKPYLNVFGGMVFGTDTTENITYIVKPDLILSKIGLSR